MVAICSFPDLYPPQRALHFAPGGMDFLPPNISSARLVTPPPSVATTCLPYRLLSMRLLDVLVIGPVTVLYLFNLWGRPFSPLSMSDS